MAVEPQFDSCAECGSTVDLLDYEHDDGTVTVLCRQHADDWTNDE